MALELGAPFALVGGTLTRLWVLGSWLLHIGIIALMGILFPYPVLGVAYACFFPVERLGQRFARRRTR